MSAMMGDMRGSGVWVGSVLVGVLLAGCGDSAAPGGETSPSGRVSSATTSGVGSADAPPAYADNNAWKHRKDATPADRQRAVAEAKGIGPVITRLRSAHAYDEAGLRKALQQIGFRDVMIETTPFSELTSQTNPPPESTAFGVRTGGRACVLGEVSPARARAEATSLNGEGTCIEAFSH